MKSLYIIEHVTTLNGRPEYDIGMIYAKNPTEAVKQFKQYCKKHGEHIVVCNVRKSKEEA